MEQPFPQEEGMSGSFSPCSAKDFVKLQQSGIFDTHNSVEYLQQETWLISWARRIERELEGRQKKKLLKATELKNK